VSKMPMGAPRQEPDITIEFIEAVNDEDFGPFDRGSIPYARMDAFPESFSSDDVYETDVSLTTGTPMISLYICLP
jgi:hypothetical protein